VGDATEVVVLDSVRDPNIAVSIDSEVCELVPWELVEICREGKGNKLGDLPRTDIVEDEQLVVLVAYIGFKVGVEVRTCRKHLQAEDI